MKKIISFFEYKQHLALGLVAVSAGMLSFAYISQYGFGLDPCALCFYQRKPYFVVIGLGLLAYAIIGKNKKAALALLWGCVLSLCVGSAIAAFHVGVEQHWWKGLESCSNYALPEHATVADLKKFIMSRSVVQCDVPAFVLFGISMTGYNFLICTAIAIGTGMLLLGKKN